MKIREEENKFINYLKNFEDLVVVDVGGNIGDYSQCVLDNLNLKKLTIVEPIESCYTQLTERFGDNDKVEIIQELIDEDIKIVTFNEVKGKEVHSSIVDRDWLYNKPGYDHEVVKRQITTQRLDNLITDNIDFLKIDTEGHELQVLKGSEKLLEEKKIKYIQFEYGGCFKDNGITLNEVISYLKNFGYSVYEIGNSSVFEINNYFDDYRWVNFFASHEDIKNILD